MAFNLFADLEKLGQKIWSEFTSHQAVIKSVLGEAATVTATVAAGTAAAGEDPALVAELGNVTMALNTVSSGVGSLASATNLIQGVTALTGAASSLIVTSNAVGVKNDATKTGIGQILSKINAATAVLNNAIVAQASVPSTPAA